MDITHEPSAGETWLDGQQVNRSPKGRAFENHLNHTSARIWAWCSQFNGFPHQTVPQNIMIGSTRPKSLRKAEAAEHANAPFAKVGLADKGPDCPAGLSGD
ncbi:hypothetical protein HJB99_29210 [Rhizobium sp. NLR17b]|uniref:hypothetical protein n=1 Tax=Rhizobium sp. NLR17b TaxID=2731114 RepID=UPI001C82A28A|nr:hypothetical protein [Rhizobium sp. NLR17b]MBX5272693.1 hypothetical protein [Rhizobium sp. NLR17b]